MTLSGVRTWCGTADANLDCVFVENALFYTEPLILKSEQNRIDLVNRPVEFVVNRSVEGKWEG